MTRPGGNLVALKTLFPFPLSANEELAMKLVIRIGAAALGLAALSACGQSGQDNTADLDANLAADEAVLPPDETAGPADTLGNQLEQLNETGNAAGAGNETGNAAETNTAY